MKNIPRHKIGQVPQQPPTLVSAISARDRLPPVARANPRTPQCGVGSPPRVSETLAGSKGCLSDLSV